MKLPIKTRILELAIEWDHPFTAEDMQKILAKEYDGERTTALKEVDKQLEMYSRVAMMKVVDVAMNSQNELQVTYVVTGAGKDSKKYIPTDHD